MAPEVVRDGWSSARDAGAIVLTHRERGEVVLLGVAAALYDLADGRRNVDELAAMLRAVPEDIFAALDELADHGLLRARVAPPAAARRRTRREVLGAIAGVTVAAAVAPRPVTAAPAFDHDEFREREAQVKDAATKTIAEHEAKFVAAKPPHEQIHKESTSKTEQQRKLATNSEEYQMLTPRVVAAENKRAEVDLLGAYESAGKRADSPAESAEKQSLEFPPELAGAREADRKQAVAALVAEEQAARSVVDGYIRAVPEVATALDAREQQAKIAGEFGPAHEQTHKALLTAQRYRRAHAGEQSDKQVHRAQQARWTADIREGRGEEQDEKAVLRVHELRDKVQATEQQVTLPEEQRDKHGKERVAQHQQRRAEAARAAQTAAFQARMSPEAEQTHKSQAAEQAQKRETIEIEIKARDHEARSRFDSTELLK